MKTLRKQQLDVVLSRFKNPVYGNKDKDKEFIFDLADANNYLVKLTSYTKTAKGKIVEDDATYAFYPQTTFEEMYFDHKKNGCYAWKNKTVQILHDPREGQAEPTPFEKKGKAGHENLIKAQLGVQGVADNAIQDVF
jgi:hypothetical protein